MSEGWTDPLGVFARDKAVLQFHAGQSFGAPLKVEGGQVVFDPAGVRWYLQAGSFVLPRVIMRLDGAKVMYWETYDSERGVGINHKNWVASAPGQKGLWRSAPMGRCGERTKGGMRAGGNPRRWKTPYAAIAAIDREFPCSAG